MPGPRAECPYENFSQVGFYEKRAIRSQESSMFRNSTDVTLGCAAAGVNFVANATACWCADDLNNTLPPHAVQLDDGGIETVLEASVANNKNSIPGGTSGPAIWRISLGAREGGCFARRQRLDRRTGRLRKKQTLV